MGVSNPRDERVERNRGCSLRDERAEQTYVLSKPMKYTPCKPPLLSINEMGLHGLLTDL